MFRSLMATIRELYLYLTKVIFMLKYSVHGATIKKKSYDVCSLVTRSHILLEKLLNVAGETGFYQNFKKTPFFPIAVMWYILRSPCMSFICSLHNVCDSHLPHS